MKFSIVLPTYNRAHLIDKAINSVLKQTYTNWELIVIDDGSTDNTKDAVLHFNDERIKYIYQENAERSAARNNGIKHAVGDWICFLDSDDEYLENHLEILYKTIINSDNIIGLYVTGHFVIKEDSIFKHPLLDTNKNILKEIWNKFILMNSVCVHKTILNNESFNVTFRIWEDTHLWLRIACQYPVFQIEHYTCRQNITSESSVVKGLTSVNYKDVVQYVNAINNFKDNYKSLYGNKLMKNDFINYIDLKYIMFLYQARQNKQLGVSLKIWFKAFFHKPSFYLFTEFPKIFINQLNIGIHEK